jgi:tRNA-specific adenosine deaminase 3
MGKYCAVLNEKLELLRTSTHGTCVIDHPIMQLAADLSHESEHYFLKDLTVLTDVEPCFMCSMALVHSRVGTVIFKNGNPTDGGLTSLHGGRAAQIFNVKQLNHAFTVF